MKLNAAFEAVPTPERHHLRSFGFLFNYWGSDREEGWHRQVIPRESFRRIIGDFTIWVFFRGKGELRDFRTGKTYPLRPGVCLCMTPGMDVEATSDPRDRLGDYFLHFVPVLDGKIVPEDRWPIRPFYTEVDDPALTLSMMRRILSLLDRSRISTDPGVLDPRFEAEFLVKAMLLHLERHRSDLALSPETISYRTPFMMMLTTLHATPNRFPDVPSMASLCGYSMSHFRVICRNLTGKTPRELLAHARIERAKDYLRHSEYAIGTIAEMVGYSDIFYFSRQFREVTGKTASQFRDDALKTALSNSGLSSARALRPSTDRFSSNERRE